MATMGGGDGFAWTDRTRARSCSTVAMRVGWLSVDSMVAEAGVTGGGGGKISFSDGAGGTGCKGDDSGPGGTGAGGGANGSGTGTAGGSGCGAGGANRSAGSLIKHSSIIAAAS